MYIYGIDIFYLAITVLGILYYLIIFFSKAENFSDFISLILIIIIVVFIVYWILVGAEWFGEFLKPHQTILWSCIAGIFLLTIILKYIKKIRNENRIKEYNKWLKDNGYKD